MKDYKKYNDQFFSRWAPIYDVFELMLGSVRKEVLQAINPRNMSVLDVATGTGSLAIELSETAAKVVGIDLSEDMLNVAKKKPCKENLSFLQMDACHMAFEDASFDIVTISLGLHDMPLVVRSKVLQESQRVLKADGKLYIFEYDLPENELIANLSSRLINVYESKYYLDFIQTDLDSYLETFGFKVEQKQSFLLHYFRLLTVGK
jgi:phosphatidylethanolamine/phosphatidyl-N-methylethanolamine N-methyltransferase